MLYHLASDPTAGVTGTVVGIEHIPELVEWSAENMRRDGLGPALDDGHVKMIAGDGRQGEQNMSTELSSYADLPHNASRVCKCW